MRRSPIHDRLHAAVVAFALCTTSVSIVFAGQTAPEAPEAPEAAKAAKAAPQGAVAGRSTDRASAESVDAFRSFIDLIAEAAREQERLSATLPSEECIDSVEAAVSASAPPATTSAATGDRSEASACGAAQSEAAM